MIYPHNFEQKTEFYKIRENIKSHCLSKLGRLRTDNILFSSDIEKIRLQLKLVEEFRIILMFADNFPTSYYIDTSEYFEKTKMLGTFFTEKELFDILRSLNTIRDIINFFKSDEENKYPELKKLAKKNVFFPFVVQQINSVIDKYGNIKNNASKTLLSIRQSLNNKQSSVSGSIRRVLNKAKTDGNIPDDTEVTVREGRLLIPVAVAYKRKIKGYVFDESATGQTAYIEPIEIIELNNEIKELEFAERREIIKILTETTNELRPYFSDLHKSYDFLGDIDFIRAKAIFANNIEAVSPKINDNTELYFQKAKHPLLFLSYKKTEKKVVASDIIITENRRIILISGPNAGGKSVALKTTALLQYMIQCGIPASVGHLSEVGVFSNIFIDIGDEQSIENDLSTYSSHLVNMSYFTKNADSKTLFFIDEFGTGTEPLPGGAIAESVLEDINSKKAKGVITTHYTNLKQFAEENEGVVNAAMLFDSDKMEPLYKLETGHPGSSFAFEIAEKTGISKKILKNAESKLDKTQIDFEKVLKETQSEKRKLKSEKRKLRNLKNKLEATVEKYENELDKALKKRKELIKDAQDEATQIISTANKKIENTIAEIRKADAEKARTKELRKELSEFAKNKEKERLEEEGKINRKIEKIKNRKEKRLVEKNREQPKQEIKKTDTNTEILIGDIVRIKGQNTSGEVTEMKKNTITVAFGSMITNIKKNMLEKVTSAQAESYHKQKSSGVKVIRNSNSEFDVNFMKGIDIRGKRADEAMQILTNYIDSAIVARHRELKILHGTGNGILREIVRDSLRAHNLVKTFRDERIEAGGAGITIATLDV